MDIFPFVDDKEDDSGCVKTQTLISVKYRKVIPLDVLILTACVGEIPPDVDRRTLEENVMREAERTVALSTPLVPLNDGDTLWYLVTWDFLQEEVIHGSFVIH